MRPLWHPISAVLMVDPPVLASASALRLLLRAGPLEVRYAGDRMGAAVPHGAIVRVRPVAGELPLGAVVVATIEGAPDLLRVAALEGERVLLRADAETGGAAAVERGAVIGLTDLPRRRLAPWTRGLRRALQDLREAAAERVDAADGADVRSKYDAQAPFYAASGAVFDPGLLARSRATFPAGGRILVAGSGVGTECFGLAKEGYDVCGLDFAPAMVAAARLEAERRGLQVRFLQADLHEHREPPGSLAGILFTYDVYSLLADRDERVSLLRRMGGWLAPGGAILLSARRARGAWVWLVLTVQWLAGGGRGAWGASHARWITVNGDVHRSFVQLFTRRALARETREAGLREGEWQGGHGCLTVPRTA